ncbi:hypothetical protein [Streptomyces sp. NPDC006971]|uniref:hypothetical protein n=1 Tax=Streptomyces sp. NPDC006971 TaxID=3154784 RepID=UPI0033E35FE3
MVAEPRDRSVGSTSLHENLDTTPAVGSDGGESVAHVRLVRQWAVDGLGHEAGPAPAGKAASL